MSIAIKNIKLDKDMLIMWEIFLTVIRTRKYFTEEPKK